MSIDCDLNLIYNNTIHNNYAGGLDSSGNGIYIIGDTALTSDDNEIIGNTIYNSVGSFAQSSCGNGIQLREEANSNDIKFNTIYNNTAVGLLSGNGIILMPNGIADVDNNNISGNIIYDNKMTGTTGSWASGNGIMLSTADFTEISNNTIYNHNSNGTYCGNGIFARESSTPVIKDNNIQNSIGGSSNDDGNGIYLRDSDNADVINNTIDESHSNGGINSGNGILSSGSTGGEFRLNRISNSYGTKDGNGIFLSAADDSIIEDNTISNCFNTASSASAPGVAPSLASATGIIISAADNVNVTGNDVSFCDGNGVQLLFSTNCNISDNYFFGIITTPCVIESLFTNDISSSIIGPNECVPYFTTVSLNVTDPVYAPNYVLISWTVVPWADIYYIYMSTDVITADNVNLLTPIADVTTLDYAILCNIEGDYYYAVVAANDTITGYISNNVWITVYPEQPNNNLLYQIIGIVAVIGVIATIFLKVHKSKGRNK